LLSSDEEDEEGVARAATAEGPTLPSSSSSVDAAATADDAVVE
jgi:hypothetical protein